MPDVTITIPPGQVARVTEALCVTGNKSPISAANAQAVLREWVRDTTVNYWKKKDTAAALAAMPPPVDPLIT
jgi:hypothetical protein